MAATILRMTSAYRKERQMTTRQARDHIIGRTQAAGRVPTTKGIGRKSIDGFVKRAMDMAHVLDSVLEAKQSGDPASVAIAEKLMANPEFVGALLNAVKKLKAEVDAEPSAAAAKPDHVDTGNGLEEGNSPNHQKSRGSGLPGADSRNVPGSYTVAHLQSDLATQNAAVAQLAAKSGMDSARAAVAASPLIPAWDSNVWSPEARQAFKDRASYDGAAAEHLKRFGVLPAHVRESDAAKVSGLYDLHGSTAEPERSPRFFDR